MRAVIVDDEKSALNNTLIKCKKLDALSEVNCFDNAEDVIAFAKENPIDIAFLDIQIGDMDGIALYAKLREFSPQIRVVFITAYDGYALEAFRNDASGYLLKPFTDEDLSHEVEKVRRLYQHNQKKLQIRAFGNFDVFVRDRLLDFRSAKAKELLALLVDRRGGVVTPEEAVACLWENREYDERTKVLFRSVLKSLTQTLREVGAEDVLHSTRNSKSIAVECVACDFYDYMQGQRVGKNMYYGQYMEQYSWAEQTKAILEFMK